MARGRKTSAYLGAKKRGGCNALELRRRLWRRLLGRGTARFEMGGFPTQKHDAMGRDFLIVLDVDGDGNLSEKLNFPQLLEDLAREAAEHGLDFKVDRVEENGTIKWDDDKRTRFKVLVENLVQKYAAPARAEEIVDTGEVNLIQGEGEPVQPQGDPIEVQGELHCEVQGDPFQGNKWSIDEGIQQSDDSMKKFCSRESESAIYSQLNIDDLLSMNGKLLSENAELLSIIKALQSEKGELLSMNQALLSEKEALLSYMFKA